eukprot:28060-Eustigmatos_ZCMA.PRE.1
MADQVQLVDPDLMERVLEFVVGASAWLSEQLTGDTEAAAAFCRQCPEHILDDLLELILHVAQHSPKTLTSSHLQVRAAPCSCLLARYVDCAAILPSIST